MELQYQILTDAERLELTRILIQRNNFKKIISNSIINRKVTFSNGLCISGKPGTGKTTLVVEFLEELTQSGLIDQYVRHTGHITKVPLFQILEPEEDENGRHKVTVHLLDDVDCMYDQGCLEILKAALDTRSASSSNRKVCYNNASGIRSYVYSDLCIIISNDQFESPSIHQQALLDRIHLFKIDLNADDFRIFTLSIIEDYLNENPDLLAPSVLDSIREFTNTEVRTWYSYDVFRLANVFLSIRLIKKFVDLQTLFGDDWRQYTIEYQKLNSKYRNLANLD